MPCGSSRSGAPISAVMRGCERIIEIDDDEAAIAQDVGVGSGNGDPARAVESAAGIEGGCAADEIIRGIAVEQRADAWIFAFEIRIADNDQAFVFVGDIEKPVHQMDSLLFVFGIVRAQRIDAERRGRRHGRGVFRLHVQALAERRNRRGDHALGEILVVDVGDVENAEAARAHRRVDIFAAKLQVENIAVVAVAVVSSRLAFDELVVNRRDRPCAASRCR